MRVRLAEMPPRYRDATLLSAGTCAITAGAIVNGLVRPLLGYDASMALPGAAFLVAGYAGAFALRYSIGWSSMKAVERLPVEATEPDLATEVFGVLLRGVSIVAGLVSLAATVGNLRTILSEGIEPVRLAAFAGTASWSIVGFVIGISLSLVHRRNLTLTLVIGNLLCLLPAVTSFIMRPSMVATFVIFWCGALVMVPLLRIDVWWT